MIDKGDKYTAFKTDFQNLFYYPLNFLTFYQDKITNYFVS